ncbi:SOS response-associated peptidase [Parasulfitobacter algicola]|uniref:Abasic site processing protein n=1 Tax=Parasulfitobacter algicola TaxID=2614809 RepID=A0ABX2IV69_9RHOB|nr:SOS response-associated peptidase [Sulfitobacter algicola]NSX56807.1 SOS response-associated peptidase [Sulfitobacter algicola]
MCNLYSSLKGNEAMRRLFEVDPVRDQLGNAQPRPAIRPKGVAPVVALGRDGERALIEMRWGFLTAQVSKVTGDPIKPRAWNNARDDKLLKSGLWSGSFRERRCLIPLTSFAESKGRKPATYYWFGVASDDPDARPLFAIAGMWRKEREDLREDEAGLTHTMITTEANDLVRPYHAKGRMPVILDPAEYETWLTGTPEQAMELVKPYAPDRMKIVLQGIGETSDPGPDLLA